MTFLADKEPSFPLANCLLLPPCYSLSATTPPRVGRATRPTSLVRRPFELMRSFLRRDFASRPPSSSSCSTFGSFESEMKKKPRGSSAKRKARRPVKYYRDCVVKQARREGCSSAETWRLDVEKRGSENSLIIRGFLLTSIQYDTMFSYGTQSTHACIVCLFARRLEEIRRRRRALKGNLRRTATRSRQANVAEEDADEEANRRVGDALRFCSSPALALTLASTSPNVRRPESGREGNR